MEEWIKAYALSVSIIVQLLAKSAIGNEQRHNTCEARRARSARIQSTPIGVKVPITSSVYGYTKFWHTI